MRDLLRTGLDVGAVGGVILATKSIANFRTSLRAQARQFRRGQMDADQFAIATQDVIDRAFRRAWRQGAAECGLSMDELSDEEQDILQARINEQFPHVVNLAADFESVTGQAEMHARLENWVARYEQIRNEARAHACADRKLIWRLGAAEHCESCLRLDGQVRRGSFWTERGILPRVAGASYLRCNGYNCQCTLQPTDAPMSRGSLPSLP